jgi:hypothetical protein
MGGFVLPAIKFDRRVGKVTIRVFTPTCLIGAILSQILVSMMKRSGSVLNQRLRLTQIDKGVLRPGEGQEIGGGYLAASLSLSNENT